MRDDLQRARAAFPLMPDDVFEIWIAPIVGRIGWPFDSLFRSAGHTEWSRLFGSHGLKVFAAFTWHRKELPYERALFVPDSQSTIGAILEHHELGIFNPGINAISDSHERFMSFKEFARVHGKLPAPCVLVREINGYRIFDGHHRIAGMAAINFGHGLRLDAWVGVHGSQFH